MLFKSEFEIDIPYVDAIGLLHNSVGFRQACQANRVAFVDHKSGQSISFRDLQTQTYQLANGLHELGWARNTVGVFSPNHLNYPVLVHGIVCAGGTVTTANPTYTASELIHQLKDAGASILVVHSSFIDIGMEAAKAVGIPISCVYSIDECDKLPCYKVLYSKNGKNRPKFNFNKDQVTKRPAYLCYSSGTTGRSKGVATSHYNMVSNILQIAAIEKLEHSGPEVWIGVLPFYHMYAMNLSLHTAAYLGFTTIVLAKFDMVDFLESIQKHKINLLHIVPPIVIGLAKAPIVEKYSLKSVRKICSGAAPLGHEISEAVMKRLGVPVMQGYGLTEVSPGSHFEAVTDIIPGSVGKLLPNMSAKIVDPESGKYLGVNERGELWMKGPNVMLGYHNNPTATRESIDKDGFFHTGDVAYVDEKGHFFIVDRLKELIKYKGLQVPPAELEALLLSLPGVADVGVIGKPDHEAGEVPVAFIVKSNPKLTEIEIMEFVAKRVAPHKQLRGGVVFVDAIPKAASGKILRRLLRDSLQKSKL